MTGTGTLDTPIDTPASEQREPSLKPASCRATIRSMRGLSLVRASLLKPSLEPVRELEAETGLMIPNGPALFLRGKETLMVRIVMR